MAHSEAQERFIALLEEHRRLLYKVASAYTRDPADRADLIQEIAAELWRSFPRYRPELRFSTWAYRVALNVAISASRREARRARTHVTADESVLLVVGDEPDVPIDDDRIERLQRFIAELGEIDRALILLYLDDATHAEMADTLGLTITAVGTRIGRIKQRLRDRVATEQPPIGASHGSR